MTWQAYDNGSTRGQVGSEGGTIILDEEHTDGVRITLEAGERATPFAITCAVYGWIVHTRYLSSSEEPRTEFAKMKEALETILSNLASESVHDEEAQTAQINELLNEFIERFA